MKFFSKKRRENSETNEFAKPIDWKPQWSIGAPMPQIFSNGDKIYLAYLIDEPDPNWDGTYVKMIDNTSETNYPLALVEFDGYTFKFGVANDEVNHGLPLWKKGLKSYSAHEIINSIWIEELKEIHGVHPQFDENRWKDLNHYVFLFHDELLEVICKDYRIEKFNTTFKKLAVEVANRMNN